MCPFLSINSPLLRLHKTPPGICVFLQHGGKLTGSVKAASPSDVGMGDIPVPDLPAGTWDRDVSSTSGGKNRILRSSRQVGNEEMEERMCSYSGGNIPCRGGVLIARDEICFTATSLL